VRESAAEAGEHRRTATRQRRIASRSRALSELLEERNELVGVYEPADLAVEMLRWSA
jgi:hypothetical protein